MARPTSFPPKAVEPETFAALRFDLQVRYSVGLWALGVDDIEWQTAYNFRRQLPQHMQETGQSLLDQAFEHVTDGPIAAFGLRTDKQRMDSTFVASNIREMSRQHCWLRCCSGFHRMLRPAEQARYAAAFAPCLKGRAGQYVYHIRTGAIVAHLQAIDELMQQLAAELTPAYAQEAACQMLGGCWASNSWRRQPA